MPDDDTIHTNGAASPSETSPLLGGGDRSKATLDPSAANGSDVENAAAANADEAVVSREGLPEVAAKMHVLVPAIGIGVSFPGWGGSDMRRTSARVAS